MGTKIEGAKKIGHTWHYYKRIPKRLREAYNLPEFKRGTMGTKDPDKAGQLARAMLTKMDELAAKLDSISSRIKIFDELSEAERDRLDDDLDIQIAKLPADHKALLGGEGSVWHAGHEMNIYEASAVFMEVGLGATFDVKDMLGEEYDPEEREDEEDRDRSSINRLKKKAGAYRSALTAAGIIEPTSDEVTGLRRLMEKYCEAKGYVDTPKIKDATRGKVAYAVRRFIEYHGDLPIADLTRKQLSDFATDFLKLPTSSRHDVRPLPFWESVRIAEREGLPCASTSTREHNLDHLKRLMKYAVHCGDREGLNPWAEVTTLKPRQKISAGQDTKVYVFTRDDVKRIVARTSLKRDRSAIDFWGPLFGAHHGLRIEELCQITVADVSTAEELLCIRITDEGENQKVKNKNTFRTIPIHADLVKMGFGAFVERRRQTGGENLFMEAAQHSGELSEITPAGDGRLASRYRQRFSTVLTKLKIIGYRAGSHSFRHAWTDLARNTGINLEHRRALAGRDSDSDGAKVRRTC